jgi:hypothetical protein
MEEQVHVLGPVTYEEASASRDELIDAAIEAMEEADLEEAARRFHAIEEAGTGACFLGWRPSMTPDGPYGRRLDAEGALKAHLRTWHLRRPDDAAMAQAGYDAGGDHRGDHRTARLGVLAPFPEHEESDLRGDPPLGWEQEGIAEPVALPAERAAGRVPEGGQR